MKFPFPIFPIQQQFFNETIYLPPYPHHYHKTTTATTITTSPRQHRSATSMNWNGKSENVDALVAMGYNRQDIEDSLSQVRYDDVFATYLLLGRKSTDVSSVHSPSHFYLSKMYVLLICTLRLTVCLPYCLELALYHSSKLIFRTMNNNILSCHLHL